MLWHCLGHLLYLSGSSGCTNGLACPQHVCSTVNNSLSSPGTAFIALFCTLTEKRTGYIALFWDLAVPPRAAVFVEMCVLLLKMHSFVHYYRNNPLTRLPTVNQFWMYLLFPTLVYEPEYPRSDRINWKNFCEIGLMCVFSISVLNQP